MTRPAVTGPRPARTRTPWANALDRLPGRRTRTVSVYPLRSEPLIGTPADVVTVLRSGQVHWHGDVTRIGHNRVRVQVIYTDRDHPTPRAPRRTGLDIDWATANLIGKILTAITVIPAAVFSIGWIVWTLWAADIIAAAKITGVALAGAAVAWWLLAHARNGCPGWHCQGCRSH